MKYKDRYEEFFKEFDGTICRNGTPWEEDICRGKMCSGCLRRFMQWLEKDCCIISKVERDFLSNVNDLYNYIGRDGAGDLWLLEKTPRLIDGIFESNDGRIYKCPDFIAGEFNGIERETYYMISEL